MMSNNLDESQPTIAEGDQVTRRGFHRIAAFTCAIAFVAPVAFRLFKNWRRKSVTVTVDGPVDYDRSLPMTLATEVDFVEPISIQFFPGVDVSSVRVNFMLKGEQSSHRLLGLQFKLIDGEGKVQFVGKRLCKDGRSVAQEVEQRGKSGRRLLVSKSNSERFEFDTSLLTNAKSVEVCFWDS